MIIKYILIIILLLSLYTEAVIDNFVPIETQQFWEGEGQYWMNELNIINGRTQIWMLIVLKTDQLLEKT